jgi:hypothetical protein
MPNNYVLLERIELNASAASVTFANIPQTGYTDLKIVASARLDYSAAVASLGVYLNTAASDTTYRWLRGNGSVAASGNSGGNQTDFYPGEVPALTATANTFSNTEIYIPNYTGSQQKSMSADSVSEQNGTVAYPYFSAGRSTKTAAVTSVTVRGFGGSGNLVSGSTFSLYGLAATGTTPAIAPKASGGNIIATDGTYWYHAFLTSGTFTPQTPLTCDLLQVAGGGGSNGGGGGAGGLLAFTSQALAIQNYTVTVGAGGATDTNGTNSQFGSLTASVGGGSGGGNSTSNPPGNGGSGGGSMGNTSPPYGTLAGGTGTAGQGNNGGAGIWGSFYVAGGGGGAGAVGGNRSGGNGGAGGAGLNTYSTWATATSTGVSGYYAGGGGGAANLAGTGGNSAGAGGAGGGGAGNASNAAGTAGTVNTGGGAGGSDGVAGVAGGSGIIIVRYTIA